MNEHEIAAVKAAIDCRALIGQYVELTEHRGSCTGPCPFCGGTNRLAVRESGWLCRTGSGHCGQKGDAIRFVMLKHGISFLAAVTYLQTGKFAQAERTRPTQKPGAVVPFDVAQWSRNIAYTMSQLTPASGQGRYLAKRRLTPHTWRTFYLGAGYVRYGETRYDAVAIPWHDRAGRLVAVNHRLLNPPDKDRRYKLAGNYFGNLFGWQTHRGDHDLIFVCEGEFNAMSVHQGLGADVLSTGSQIQEITPEQAEEIRRWDRIVLWADDPKVAECWQKAIGRGEIIKSDQDANELLQQGEL